LVQEGGYPFDGLVCLRLDPKAPSRFALRLRVPGWCTAWRVRLNGSEIDGEPDATGFVVLDRAWAAGDAIEFELAMPPRVIADALGNQGRLAVTRGPLVYAADSACLPPGRLLDDVALSVDPAEPTRSISALPGDTDGVIRLAVPTAIREPRLGPSAWRERERYFDLAGCAEARTGERLELVPFFLAGNGDPDSYRQTIASNVEPVTNISFQVWLPYVCGSPVS
jgi:DUF1680 family protein